MLGIYTIMATTGAKRENIMCQAGNDARLPLCQFLKSARARKKAGFRPLFLLPVNVETWDLEQMIFSFIPKSHKNFEVLAPI